MFDRLKTYITKNQDALLREARFVLLVMLWIGIFVFINRDRWKMTIEQEQLKDFAELAQQHANDFESHLDYWDVQPNQMTQASQRSSPAELRQQLQVWKASFAGRQDWLATHIVSQRKGFEPSVTGSIVSSRVQPLLASDSDSPVPWMKEIQTSAMQIAASLKPKQRRNVSQVRSLKANANWVQAVFYSASQKPGWNTWIVHTLSEHSLPLLLDRPDATATALFNTISNRTLLSSAFAELKLDRGELSKFIKSRTPNSGSLEYQFATQRKPSWVAWSRNQQSGSVLVTVLPYKKIPAPLLPNAPSPTLEFFNAQIWLAVSYQALKWTHAKGWWQLRIQPKAQPNQDATANSNNPQSIFESKLPEEACEREFCSHLLSDFGPSGEVRLPGQGLARVQTIAAEKYKGSWWTIKAIDKKRSLIAVGDTTGSGIAAGAAAYTIKVILERALNDAKRNDDNEELIKQLFNLCTLSAEGALLGSSYVAVFMAIVSIENNTMVFINAGYPAPMLIQNARKKVLLVPDRDPLGLGVQEDAMPRWVNLMTGCKLSICNVGVRNADLPQIDDSELIKITVAPFGEADEGDTEIQVDGAA